MSLPAVSDPDLELRRSLLADLLEPAAGKDPVHLASPGSLAAHVTNGAELEAPHLELIDTALVGAVRNAGRVLIEMPPRHGKSRRASTWGPAWFLANHPDRRVILASYEADFAATWGRAVRSILEANDLGVSVSRTSAAASRWDLAGRAGGMVTAGVGGPITGRGANLLIVDDPVKNHEEAHSPTYRDRTWDWWRSVALPRLEPGGAAVVIMTRWHEDDLAGRILADEGERWSVLRLPAVAEEADALDRDPGEALWPARYDHDALAAIEAEVGAYTWASLYQQRPAPAEGGLLRREWFRYWEPDDAGFYRLGGDSVNPEACYRFATIDLAVSTKTSADWTVCAAWAVTPDGDLILLDLERRRVEEGSHWPLVRGMVERHRLRWIGVESRTFGTTLVFEAGRARLPVRELKADADKFTRALPAAARLEAGRVWFPAGAPWLADFEHELAAFPNGAHDDQVDVLAYAAREIATHGASRVRVPEPAPESLSERVWAEKHRREQQRSKRRPHDVLGSY